MLFIDSGVSYYTELLMLYSDLRLRLYDQENSMGYGRYKKCLTVSVAPFSLRFLSDDEGVRELWQGPVEAEPERLTQPPPQLGEALPPGRRRHTSPVLPRMRRHPEVSEAVHKLRGGVNLLRHDVCPDQSEACFEVTWSVLTNQRPVSELYFGFCCRISD